MQGYILFCSTSDVYELENINSFDVRLQITRYIKKGLLTNFIQATGLAPSEKLLNKTNLQWKKGMFTFDEKEQMKIGETHTWWDLYKPAFLKEIETRKDFQANYKRLKQLLDEGKNIIAVCYCKEYDKCHRSIIAYNLIKEGYKVILK